MYSAFLKTCVCDRTVSVALVLFAGSSGSFVSFIEHHHEATGYAGMHCAD